MFRAWLDQKSSNRCDIAREHTETGSKQIFELFKTFDLRFEVVYTSLLLHLQLAMDLPLVLYDNASINRLTSTSRDALVRWLLVLLDNRQCYRLRPVQAGCTHDRMTDGTTTLATSGDQCIPGAVFSYKERYIVGFWLVETAVSTNQKPTIYRNLYENTGPERFLGLEAASFSGCNNVTAHVLCSERKYYSPSSVGLVCMPSLLLYD